MKKAVMFLFVFDLIAHPVLGDDGRKKASSMKMPVLSTEQRQTMANAHEKMAACLRSDRPLEICHEEMMKTCKEGMGKNGCPMMGGMMGEGMHHK
jgi:hypothetical protein